MNCLFKNYACHTNLCCHDCTKEDCPDRCQDKIKKCRYKIDNTVYKREPQIQIKEEPPKIKKRGRPKLIKKEN